MFALVDANNFYVSCERVFQPHLNKRPVAVLSNNDGCIIARSDEVKALGCKMGEPFFKIKDRLKQHHTKIFSSNYALYGDMSARLMQTLSLHNQHCEVYSIDEAFLYYKDTTNLAITGQSLRQLIKQWTGLPVGIGFGKTKTLAKAANRLAKMYPKKYQGVCVLDDDTCDKQLTKLPVDDLWGVGRRHARYLLDCGICNAYDFKYACPSLIKKQMHSPGLMLQHELHGRVCHELIYEADERKSICSSKSFSKRVYQKEILKAAVLANTMRAYEKLRTHQLQARHMMVFIQSSRFDNLPVFYRSSVCLDHTACSSSHLIEAACKALDDCYQKGPAYHKSGVLLWGLGARNQAQLSLFENTAKSQRDHQLDHALDCLKKRYGKDCIQTATISQYHPHYAMKQNLRSPRFTTCWQELLTVK